MTTTWYILSPLDQLCDKCPVPRRCNENDQRCLRRQALAAGNISREKPALREVQTLNYLNKYSNESHSILDIAEAIGTPCRRSIRYILKKLRDKDQATTTGQGKTRRWTAKHSP